MIKKWSYVVAAAATVFGGSILTGCIDNDEPFGIKEIRVETANLLKAKQALVSADAAYKLAQAELEKANAEIARINAEVSKAQAEAQMKLDELQKQAEVAKTQAEAEQLQALADYQKAVTEAYIASQKAELDKTIAQNQEAITKAQIAEEQARYEWELTKIKWSSSVSDPLWEKLTGAYDAYLTELQSYNEKVQSLADLQRESAQWLNDLVFDEKTQTWTHPKDKYKKNLESAIAKQEQNIKNAENAISTLNDQIADFENIKTNNEVYVKWTDLKNELNSNEAKKQELNIQLAEIELNNQPLLNEISTLWAAYVEVGNKEIEIPAYTFEPSPTAVALGIIQPKEIVPENTTYSLNKLENYTKYQGKYTQVIKELKDYLLDENDVAWTKARVNEMTRQLEMVQTTFDGLNAHWENAKEVYNNGEEVKADKLPLETELEEAITKYNALDAKLVALKDKFDIANEELTEAQDAYGTAQSSPIVNETFKAAFEAYDEAITKAWDDYYASAEAANNAKTKAYDEADQAVTYAWKAYVRAQVEWGAYKSQLETDPENKTLQQNVKDAEKRMTDAKTAAETAETNAVTSKGNADTACTKAIAAAVTKRELDINKAEAIYDAAEKVWIAAGKDEPDLAALATAVQEKSDAVDAINDEAEELKETASDLADDLYAIYNEQLKAINLTGWLVSTAIPADGTDAQNCIDAILNGQDYTFQLAEAPILYMDNDGVYLNAKDYLVWSSRAAYGYLGSNYYYNEFNGASHNTPAIKDLEIDKAFLIPGANITTDMLNTYVKNWYYYLTGTTIEDYKCTQYYTQLFAEYGQVKYLENRIEVANANLANSDLISNVLGSIEEKKQALIDSIDPVKEEQAKAEAAYNEKSAEYGQLFTDINNQLGAIAYQNNLINRVIGVINQNFNLLNDQNAVNPDAVQATINSLKEQLAGKQTALESAQTALEEAQNNLALLENGNAEYDFNPFTSQISDLTSELEVAKDELAAAKSRLDEIQAKYEAAAKQ